MEAKRPGAKDKAALEVWNATTHGIGVALGVVFLVQIGRAHV